MYLNCGRFHSKYASNAVTSKLFNSTLYKLIFEEYIYMQIIVDYKCQRSLLPYWNVMDQIWWSLSMTLTQINWENKVIDLNRPIIYMLYSLDLYNYRYWNFDSHISLLFGSYIQSCFQNTVLLYERTES